MDEALVKAGLGDDTIESDYFFFYWIWSPSFPVKKILI